jgi:murein DD-endopeptidase MepM/ murein hydrolase activator NlpD
VYCPLEGTVHSFADNNNHGDYGPTIILEHKVDQYTFYTLYGHLSRTSLSGLRKGLLIKTGVQFAALGAYDENVHWPPHLHFQLMRDLGDKTGDYPGVCARSEQDFYLQNCPDPNLILQVSVLE